MIDAPRGCTFDCSFCSIIEMRGRNFENFSFARVIADIQNAYNHGARSIFIIDDNITLDVKRFEGLCRAIIKAGLNKIDYSVQAMTSAIANQGEHLFSFVPHSLRNDRHAPAFAIAPNLETSSCALILSHRWPSP
jgi:tRNA A37 methylthiotransferase MiaB